VEDSWNEPADWSQALDRDPRAFAAIFDHHEGRVFRHSLRLLESYHDAEDVTAASFFELWRRRDDVRLVAGSTLPWLLVTATNLSLNTRRGLRRYRTMLDRLPREPQVNSSVDIDLDENAELYRAIKGLGSADGTLLILTTVEDVPVGEAAALLGITDGAARVRLHRAKKRLQNQLDASGERMQGVKGVDR
jgi:RNA polymerase sigma factor (sigma-70 family)